MKKLALTLCLIIFPLLLLGCKKENKLVVATAANFAPFEYKEGKEFKGIDIEIAQEIAKRLGKTLEILDIEFDSVVSAINSGNADFGISGLTINATRSKVINFSIPYYNAAQVVIVREEDYNPALEGDTQALIDWIKAKNGVKIGVQSGSTGAFYAIGDANWGFEGFKNAEVKSFTNGSLATNALSNRQIDLVIIDEAPAKMFVAANAGTRVINTYLTEEEYGVGVNKNNQELLQQINDILKQMQEDGSLKTILQKYF
ncbi:transporter substrate-binding domain-containing protein [Helicobacter mesocricetorum]|uniref:transporter substrate-binding domain-containing protein n=1 Tax=Helicobacter mesocricetorum TaxID=87012 RepID=UPI000CF114DF|nr:transporter substrate-binding domain-containing protein [Helicobacter mesocricetorum]